MDTKRIDIDGYEKVFYFADTDFSAYIAIHSTKLGPALGGCRLRRYESDHDALQDALRLSKGMSYKNALAGLNFGGGKCVVNADKATPEIMQKVGEAVEHLGGLYITAEDVGTSVDDMKVLGSVTKHVASLGEAGDPSPWTALGVYEAIMEALSINMPYVSTPAVWIQGLGKVGMALAEHLHGAGCALYVNDLNSDRVQQAIENYDAILYKQGYADLIHVYAPCALSNAITKVNVETIKFPIICGSANNQLESDDLAEILWKNEVVYCPDFLVNAGGVIAVGSEVVGFDRDRVEQSIMDIADTLSVAIELADRLNVSPLRAALSMAEMRLR